MGGRWLVQAAGPYDVEPELTAREVVLTGFFSSIGLYDPVTADMEREADRLLGLVGLHRSALCRSARRPVAHDPQHDRQIGFGRSLIDEH